MDCVGQLAFKRRLAVAILARLWRAAVLTAQGRGARFEGHYAAPQHHSLPVVAVEVCTQDTDLAFRLPAQFSLPSTALQEPRAGIEGPPPRQEEVSEPTPAMRAQAQETIAIARKPSARRFLYETLGLDAALSRLARRELSQLVRRPIPAMAAAERGLIVWRG